MFGSIASRYDLTNTILSFGVHHLWRWRLLSALPRSPDLTVVDLCTGTGDLLAPLRKRYRTVIGADFCYPMLRAGVGKFPADLSLLQADALRLPFADGSVDLITVAFGVRNLENLDQGLREVARVLKPGGTLVVLEFGQPRGILFPALFRFYQNFLMPIIGGLLTGNRQAYVYLPKTSRAFPCGEQFMVRIGQAGLKPAAWGALTGGIAYLYRGVKS